MRAAKYLLSAMVLCAAAVILISPQTLMQAVTRSLEGCLETVIPSLFAFTVLAIYMQQSGLYTVALRPLTLPLSRLLGIPEELCAVYLLSNIGGYPVGARLLTQLVHEGRLPRNQAGRLLCCCYGGGPSFVLGTVGMRVFGSARAGGMIYAACLLSSLIMAVVICRTGEKPKIGGAAEKADLSAKCFVRSVDSGARVMYTVCIMAVFFAAAASLTESIGISSLAEKLFAAAGGNADNIFPALLEITRISDLTAGGAAASLCAGLLSFGGVCVLLQIAAITGGAIPLKPLILSRVPAALMSALFALPASLIPLPAAEAYSEGAVSADTFSVNAGLSVCVMIMAGILIYSVEKERGR